MQIDGGSEILIFTLLILNKRLYYNHNNDYNIVVNLKFVLASDLLVIEKRFTAKPHLDLVEIPKSYLVKAGDGSYVITEDNTIQVFHFGMTPQNASNQLNITTARAEGKKNGNDDSFYNGSKAIFLLPEFKKPIFSQRCIVIADAFYAMSDRPYLVYLQNKVRPIGFAGVYDIWQNPNTKETVNGFAIITIASNSMLQSIGVKRMPVILPPHYETDWLKNTLTLSKVLNYLVPFSAEKMNAYPVSEMVNVGGVNDISLLKPIGEKLRIESTPMPIVRSHYPHKTKPASSDPWFKSEVKE